MSDFKTERMWGMSGDARAEGIEIELHQTTDHGPPLCEMVVQTPTANLRFELSAPSVLFQARAFLCAPRSAWAEFLLGTFIGQPVTIVADAPDRRFWLKIRSESGGFLSLCFVDATADSLVQVIGKLVLELEP